MKSCEGQASCFVRQPLMTTVNYALINKYPNPDLIWNSGPFWWVTYFFMILAQEL